MNRLAAGVFAVELWAYSSGMANAEQYSLGCFGPHFGSAAAPVSVAVDTAKKQFDVAGEASSEVAIDDNKVSAMNGSQMYQLDLSNMEGIVLNDDGLSNFECKSR